MNDADWLRKKGIKESVIEDIAERIAILIYDGGFTENDARIEALNEHLKRTRSKAKNTSIQTG